METKVKIHEHGEVILLDAMGTDETIDNSARVSFTGEASNERSPINRQKLINYLMRNGHTSPFEMVETRWFVKAPLFVARQWVRHRTASWNEISGRYVKLPDEYYKPMWRGKPDGSVKQGAGHILPKVDRDVLDVQYDKVMAAIKMFQATADHLNVANEQSRVLSPLSQYTAWVWKIDLHNLFHFLRLRLDPHAQGEIRAYAEAMVEEVKAHWPMAWGAFEKYRINGED